MVFFYIYKSENNDDINNLYDKDIEIIKVKNPKFIKDDITYIFYNSKTYYINISGFNISISYKDDKIIVIPILKSIQCENIIYTQKLYFKFINNYYTSNTNIIDLDYNGLGLKLYNSFSDLSGGNGKLIYFPYKYSTFNKSFKENIFKTNHFN